MCCKVVMVGRSVWSAFRLLMLIRGRSVWSACWLSCLLLLADQSDLLFDMPFWRKCTNMRMAFFLQSCWQSWLQTCVDIVPAPFVFNILQIVITFRCHCALRVCKALIACHSCSFFIDDQKGVVWGSDGRQISLICLPALQADEGQISLICLLTNMFTAFSRSVWSAVRHAFLTQVHEHAQGCFVYSLVDRLSG